MDKIIVPYQGFVIEDNWPFNEFGEFLDKVLHKNNIPLMKKEIKTERDTFQEHLIRIYGSYGRFAKKNNSLWGVVYKKSSSGLIWSQDDFSEKDVLFASSSKEMVWINNIPYLSSLLVRKKIKGLMEDLKIFGKGYDYADIYFKGKEMIKIDNAGDDPQRLDIFWEFIPPKDLVSHFGGHYVQSDAYEDFSLDEVKEVLNTLFEYR